MNPAHAIFAKQSNVATGHKTFASAADLTGKEAHLATLANNAGVIEADLPAAAGDAVHGIIGEGGAAEAVIFFPLPGDTFRVKLTGACNPLDKLTSVGDGTVEANGAGTFVGQAEEVGVTGQLVLARALPANPARTEVTDQTTDGAAAAAAADLAALSAETELIGDTLRATLAALESAGIITVA